MSSFVEWAGERRLPPEEAQKLVDMHAAVVRQVQEAVTQRQFDTFADTVTGWERDSRADPDFANRWNTVVNDARWMVKQFGGSEEQVQELRNVLMTSGVGVHRSILRLLSNAAKQLKEARPGARPAPQSARPADPAERRYGRVINGSAM